MDSKLIADWLEATNEEYMLQHIPQKERPWKAMMDYSSKFKVSVVLGSELADEIFNWFKSNSKPGSHAIGPLFTGCFYFDTTFWRLDVPVFYGEVSLSPFYLLDDMPKNIIDKIKNNPQHSHALAVYWSDCLDYSLGYEFIISQNCLNEKSLIFFKNAHKELVGSISQILLPRVNEKAILSLRLSTEIFMKSCLLQELELTEKQLKGLSHKIEDIATECYKATRDAEYLDAASCMSVFPHISSRYDGEDVSFSDLWLAIKITQRIASTVTRRYTPNDIRPQLFRNE